MTKPLWEKSILLSENDSTLRRIMRKSFTEMGAVVETTENPRTIANLTSKKVFDLMILEQKIEAIDAKIISKSIMSKPDYKDSHVIILASSVDMEDLEQRKEFCVSTYIIKPFQMDKLIATVQKLLSA